MNHYFLRYPGGKTKAVTFSYDDGCRSDYKLLEILNKYNMKCTFNISSYNIVNEKVVLDKEEIVEHILNKGHELANHGAKHRAPGALSLTDGICEMLDGRRELERMFGGIIRGLAYPNSGVCVMDNGAAYSDVKTYLSNLGIVYARSTGGDNSKFLLPDDWHNWMPTAHHDNPELLNWIDDFIARDINSIYIARRRPLLMYIWGHSAEFDRNNNWDRLELICEKLYNRDDIWYATNIEIYDYTMAYRSLQFNVDRTICYNPTQHSIWFVADGKDYCINPGETLTFI